MSNPKQWSIRRMLLWVFVAALVCSHLATFYQSQIVGYTDFSVGANGVMEWIAELDPSAEAYSRSGKSGSSGEASDSDLDFRISTEGVGSVQILDHIRENFRLKADREQWAMIQSGRGGDTFEFSLSKGVTRFRIYCWILPVGESAYDEMLKEQGKSLTRIKIIQVGYRAQ